MILYQLHSEGRKHKLVLIFLHLLKGQSNKSHMAAVVLCAKTEHLTRLQPVRFKQVTGDGK